jgi:redox-sensitive bicupin YhaK (pirin superfamily)
MSIMEKKYSRIRPVEQLYTARPTLEGAGVKLKRGFGFGEVGQFDPFLLLDDFHSDNPMDYLAGFPWHPHRGIETITYILRGEVAHGDSIGNSGVIRPGEVQWMTAGRGIIHQEMPKQYNGTLLWGFQLWANLPASKKMTEPKYQGITAGEIPQVELANGTKIKVICGEVGGTGGPVRGVAIDPEYLDVTVPAGGEFSHPLPEEKSAFAYVLEGEGLFGLGIHQSAVTAPVGPETVVRFGKGDTVAAKAAVKADDSTALRFLLVSGKPLKEPIAWKGPIVMNTDEELHTAFQEYRKGTFIT